MRKLLALFLAMMMLPCAVLAEETPITPLPIDFTPGPAPDPALFTESGYEDASIQVKMERVWYEGSHYNVARVKIADPSQLRTALAAPFGKQKTNKISTIAKDNNAVVAIGGDYYGNEEGGLVVRMGEIYRKKPLRYRDMLIIDEAGDFHILKNSDPELLKAVMEAHTLVNVFNFGPALVIDGQKQDMPKDYEYNITGMEPRCAFGQIGPLEYLLVVVDGGKGREVTIQNADGTEGKSSGCKVDTLARFMAEQGCQQAYNLDGGNSALMVLGQNNYSRKSFKAERAVTDIVYFATAIAAEASQED